MTHVITDRTRFPKSLQWTPVADQRLLKYRQDGESMRSIARAFGLSRTTVTDRARALGLEIPAKPRAADKPAVVMTDHQRDPLPPGHPISWGLLIAGTSLEGNPYTPPQPPRARPPRARPPATVGAAEQ